MHEACVRAGAEHTLARRVLPLVPALRHLDEPEHCRVLVQPRQRSKRRGREQPLRQPWLANRLSFRGATSEKRHG